MLTRITCVFGIIAIVGWILYAVCWMCDYFYNLNSQIKINKYRCDSAIGMIVDLQGAIAELKKGKK